MRHCILTFRSVTPAQRGEVILKREGINCTLQRPPRSMPETGCGYSLMLRQQDAIRSAELLRRNQIPFQKSYQRRENGCFEEMAL